MIDDRLMKPIITISGATRESHVDARRDAMEALRTAMAKLQEIRPHGRDYIGNSEAYQRDLAIYSARFASLDKLFNELYDEALLIHEGGNCK